MKNFSSSHPVWTSSVVRHHFSRLMDSIDPFQLHVFLLISPAFIQEWEPEFREKIVQRVFLSLLDDGGFRNLPTGSLPERILATDWIAQSVRGGGDLAEFFLSQFQLLVPSPRDPRELAESKLLAFGNCEELPISAELDHGVCFRYLTRNETEIFAFVSKCMQSSKRMHLSQVIPSVIQLAQLCPHDSFLHDLGTFINSIQPVSMTLAYFPLLAYLAGNPILDPTVIASSLSRFIRAAQIQWEDGLQILELCRLMVSRASSFEWCFSLLTLLRSTTPCPIDIADRCDVFENYLRRLHVDDRGTFLSTDRKLQLTAQPDPPIGTHEVTLHPSISTHIAFSRNVSKRRTELGIVDDAWAVFDRSADDKIRLPFILRYMDGDTPSFPSRMFGIEIFFSSCSNFGPIEPVKVPYLQRNDEGVSGFPYSYDIELLVTVIRPVPTTFTVNMVFTDSTGRAFTGALEPFRISFSDLILPQPIPAVSFLSPIAKLLPIGSEDLRTLIASRLAHFETHSLDDSTPVPEFDFEHESILHGTTTGRDSQPQKTSVAIRVPPNHTLVFRFLMGPQTSVVWVFTDYDEILGELDEYFKGFHI
jgi:hypothetical protein